jgi:hypothetical protein
MAQYSLLMSIRMKRAPQANKAKSNASLFSSLSRVAGNMANDKLSSRAALSSTSLIIQSDQTDREQPLRGLLQRHVRFPFDFFLLINSDYNLSQLYTLPRIISSSTAIVIVEMQMIDVIIMLWADTRLADARLIKIPRTAQSTTNA